MHPLHLMTILIIVSMIIMVVGYSWRDTAWGPALVMIGMLSMMSSLAFRIAQALSF